MFGRHHLAPRYPQIYLARHLSRVHTSCGDPNYDCKVGDEALHSETYTRLTIIYPVLDMPKDDCGRTTQPEIYEVLLS